MERAWLEQLLAAGYSLERISELAGKHHSTVGYWVRKHGLRAAYREKYAPKGGVEEARLRQLVEGGLSVAAIAQELSLSVPTIRYWLERFRLQTEQSVRTEAYRRARSNDVEVLEMVCPRQKSGQYRCARCSSRGVSDRRRRMKEMLVREAGGRCHLCAYDRYQGALHFHHLDRTEKVFAVGHDGNTRSLRGCGRRFASACFCAAIATPRSRPESRR